MSPRRAWALAPLMLAALALALALAAPLLGVLAAVAASPVRAEEIGSVDTAFKWLGPNHKIVIEAFDDPKVPGVACHISRPQAGGVSGALGLAEDPSHASIACRQVGPITADLSRLEEGEQVFKERLSPLFKTIQVVRFYDRKRRTLVYLIYSDKLIDGSYKNAISTVPVMPWRE